MSWDLAATDVGAPYDHIFDVVVTDNRLVGLAWHDRKPATWISDDGSTWAMGAAPGSFATRGESFGQTIVASTSSGEYERALSLHVSYDAADHWQDVIVDLGEHGEECQFEPEFAVADGTLLAATGVYCRSEDESVGVAVLTTDGREWSVGPRLASAPDAVVVLPTGFMSLYRREMTTQLSRDGLAWYDGPTLREVNGTENVFATAAAGPLGLLVVPTAPGSDGRHVLFAAADDLAAGIR